MPIMQHQLKEASAAGGEKTAATLLTKHRGLPNGFTNETPPCAKTAFLMMQAGQKSILMTNDEAVLLTDGMTIAQIKEFCAIDTHQNNHHPLTVGALIDSILQVCRSPHPLDTDTPQKVIKNGPTPRKTPRIRF